MTDLPTDKKTKRRGNKTNIMSLDKRMRDMESNMGRMLTLLENKTPVATTEILTPIVESDLNKEIETARRNVVPGTEAFHEAVDDILGEEFEFRFGEGAEDGCYLAEIIVPSKYDRRAQALKRLSPEDVRVKVIPVVGGMPRFKQYCKMVKGHVQQGNPAYVK